MMGRRTVATGALAVLSASRPLCLAVRRQGPVRLCLGAGDVRPLTSCANSAEGNLPVRLRPTCTPLRCGPRPALRRSMLGPGHLLRLSQFRRRSTSAASSSSVNLQKAIRARLDHAREQHAGLVARLDACNDLSPEERGMLTKELHALQPVMNLISRVGQQREELEQLTQLIEESKTKQDKEMRQLAEEDYKLALGDLAETERELENEILAEIAGKDEADEKSAILEVRAAAGGQESQLFTMELFKMYQAYAETKGWNWEVLNVSDGELGGYRESSACVTGERAFGMLKFETGVHRVQRVPETEAQGRTHTSTVTVAVLPMAQEADINILPKDIRVDTYRASGPGGQHVNKTDSAVRVTHIPTGITVAIQDDRSQHRVPRPSLSEEPAGNAHQVIQNRDRALKVLRSRLYEIERERLSSSRAEERRKQVGSGQRHERIRTYNFPQSRVTDHRCGVTVHDVESMMQGHHLDTFIDALVAHHLASALKDAL